MSPTSVVPFGNDLPHVETPLQRHAVQAAGVIAVLATFGYLTWRVLFTLGADLWLAVALVLLEVHALASLVLYVFSLWDVDRVRPPTPRSDTDLRVVVVIPTYNEAREVIVPTIAAAVALEPWHETWVLDDGDRPWVRETASQLGARYFARPEHLHAKAGNINYALRQADVDVVAVLDADHVPARGFLTNTLGYFDDPTVAVVQTPQEFYNVDSFEHDRNRSLTWRRRRGLGYSEQRLFYRAIQPGKNRWDAAFWCGTGALVRAKALRQVGGVATETVTEDIHTTLRMHRLGWRSVFHNEVLAYGLAASDAQQYQSQRLRWGTGAMQLLRTERPITGPGLTPGQRMSYAATLLGWFDAWRTLGYVLLPLAVLATGAMPVAAPGALFVTVFAVVFLLQRIALGALSRGYAPQGMAILFEFIRMPTNLRATLTLFSSGERPFTVTHKGGSQSRHRVVAPQLLRGLLVGTAVLVLWGALGLAGLTPVSYREPWIAKAAIGWALLNGAFLVAAVRRIGADRFAVDRRSGVRLRLDHDVTVDDHAGYLVDISVGGALVRVDAANTVDDSCVLGLVVNRQHIYLRGHVRNRMADAADGALLAVQFESGQHLEAGQLVGSLIGGTPARPLVGARGIEAWS